MRANPSDRHATRREQQTRKARYGMRVTGRSVQLLARLTGSRKVARRRKPVRRR